MSKGHMIFILSEQAYGCVIVESSMTEPSKKKLPLVSSEYFSDRTTHIAHAHWAMLSKYHDFYRHMLCYLNHFNNYLALHMGHHHFMVLLSSLRYLLHSATLCNKILQNGRTRKRGKGKRPSIGKKFRIVLGALHSPINYLGDWLHWHCYTAVFC